MYAKAIGAGLVVLGFLVCYAVGRSDGAKLEASANHALRAQEAVEYNLAIQGAYKRKAETEAKWQAAFSKAGKDYQRRLADNAKALDIAISGSRLFDRNARSAPGGDSCAPTPGIASGRDGGSGAYLSDAAGSFLRRLASECDAVAIQLGAAQELLRSERR